MTSLLKLVVIGTLLSVAFLPTAFAQLPPQRSPPLTNDDVITMVKAGYPTESVVLVIRGGLTEFVLTPNTEAELVRGGVNQAILAAMRSAKADQNSHRAPEAVADRDLTGQPRDVNSSANVANDDVIRMVKAGVASQNVLMFVRQPELKFDTTSGAVIRLVQSGVPNEIVTAMQQRNARTLEAATKGTEASTKESSRQSPDSDLLKGDVILKLNGKPVKDRLGLLDKLVHHEESETVLVEFRREGREGRLRTTALDVFDFVTRRHDPQTLSFWIRADFSKAPGKGGFGILDIAQDTISYTSFDRKRTFAYKPGDVTADDAPLGGFWLHLPEGKSHRAYVDYWSNGYLPPNNDEKLIIAAIERSWAGEPLYDEGVRVAKADPPGRSRQEEDTNLRAFDEKLRGLGLDKSYGTPSGAKQWPQTFHFRYPIFNGGGINTLVISPEAVRTDRGRMALSPLAKRSKKRKAIRSME